MKNRGGFRVKSGGQNDAAHDSNVLKNGRAVYMKRRNEKWI